MLDGEDVPGNDVPGDTGFVPKPVVPVPKPVAPLLISDSVEGTGGPVGVNGVLVKLEPVEPAAPAHHLRRPERRCQGGIFRPGRLLRRLHCLLVKLPLQVPRP